MKKTNKSEKGISLVELTVTIAIVSILSLSLGVYMFQTTRMNKNAERNNSINKLKTNLIQSTSRPDTLIRTERLDGSITM